jgi:L-rhamnose mutarotase
MSTTEPSPLERLMMESGGDEDIIGDRIAGVLEFLTIRAVTDAAYTIYTDDKEAMVLFATGEDVKRIMDSIPEDVRVKAWDEPMDENTQTFLTDQDPGDEQDEPTPESE